MSDSLILSLGNEHGTMLIVAMLVGIVVSLIQAVTQINEATLSFIPKIVAISIVLVVAAPWMLEVISTYTTDLISRFPEIIRMQ
jgi:flagellar biosynthesis protein FliQ